MKESAKTTAGSGLAGWLLNRLRGARRPAPRLALLERIALAPRQSLALVEAEGRRFLVATSPGGAPAFYALDGALRAASPGVSRGRISQLPNSVVRAAPDKCARISW